MRVFVTGATGFIGSAVVQDLHGAGHQVLGLARSDASAASLAATGAEVLRGSIEDLDSLKAGAADSDGVIHAAFNHDFSRFMQNCEEDRLAIEAIGAALEGSDRPLLTTSGLLMLAPGRVATEADSPPEGFPRKSESAAMALAARGLKASTVRLSPTVHGAGDHGFVPTLIAIARAKGVSAYIGDGLNRWPGVHRLDAARLFRLALEQGTGGQAWHGVADEGVPTREIARVISRRLNLPLVSITPEQAGEHFGFLANFFGMDAAASSARTRETLGWRPTRPGLLEDLDQPHYFEG